MRATMVLMGRRRSLFPRQRRRRASGGDAALGIVVVVGVAIAAFGIYLLVAGAVALIGWLVAVAAKRETPHMAPQFVPASPPSGAPVPEQQYHVVLPVSPNAFSDARSLEDAASAVFAAWARQLPKAPADPRGALRQFALRKRLIGRLTTKLDGRRFGWQTAAYGGRDRVLSSGRIDPSTLDPYNPPYDLRARSSYLSLCRGCGGDGRVSCTTCGGAAKVPCVGCEGVGKKMGITANGARRMLNCKTCKGKASVACQSCRKGQLDCVTCQRSGRVESWLEIEGGPRDGDVQVEPDGEITRAFVWGKDGVAAADEEILRDANVVCMVTRDRLLTVDDLPDAVPVGWRASYWQPIQARLQPGERVVGQTFTLLEVPSIEVTYAVGREAQSIELEGLRMLAPPISADQLFRSRASALRRLAYMLGAVPIIVAMVYAARGAYFISPATLGVVLCTCVASAVVYGVVWQSSLLGSARRWLASAVVPIAAATTLAILAEPSNAEVRRYIEAGQLDRAKAELEALGDPRDKEQASLWADLHLKHALATTSCPAAAEWIAKLADNSAQRAQALAHADRLAVAATESALQSQRLDEARVALECASDASRTRPEGLALQARMQLAMASQCLNAKDWPCVMSRTSDARALGAIQESDTVRAKALSVIRADLDFAVGSAESEKELPRRVTLQRTAIDLWTTYLANSGDEPSDLVALRTRNAKDEQAFARYEEQQRKRRELEEQRQREAEAREERKRAAEEQKRLAAEAATERRRAAQERAEEQRSQSCCRVCTRGCPCGDSCISCSKTCHKGRGCAC
jgi:hypothetical protein